MTTYIPITDPETDPDAPLTSELAKKWRDNPIALIEGPTGAVPIISSSWHPYNMVLANDGATGLFWDFAVDGSAANKETPDFVAGWDYRFRANGLQGTSNSAPDITLEVFRDVGALYNPSFATVSGFNSTATHDFIYELNSPMSVRNVHFASQGGLGTTSYSSAANLSTSLIHRFATAQGIRKIRVAISLGSFVAGKLYLERRRAYS